MAVLPLLFNNWWDDYDYPYVAQPSFWGHQQRPTIIYANYSRPQQHQQQRSENGLVAERESRVNIGKNKFEVILDVQQFEPNEVNVQVVKDYLVVEGKHEEKQDEHGYVTRQFVRRYKIPQDVDPDTITPVLSSDGMLTLRAPLKTAEPPKSQERVIPIEHTGKPARVETPKAAEPKRVKNKQ